ncbi:globin domain-containing protein [Azospirillum sp. TSO22-1]|uniref:globin domain-containing protein n=1 Tax=Azospirillum sp. TSO22-1 TaxID=716789 RepID=UPI000D6054EE|nr:globin domain-containing protein [Azospirillum sp. TSO22-1]PWC36768.1 hypothetical protein TSO221_28775 [Azospirillum sp. TSO22-1]
MSPDDMETVRRSFCKVAMLNARVGLQFYERLFALDPDLRALFGEDVHPQAEKLVATLASAVRHLSNPAALEGSLRAMGERHRGYGVRDEHYATVGEALLSTLETNLGPEFTPDVRGAWLALYGMVARMMRGDGACAPLAPAGSAAAD